MDFTFTNVALAEARFINVASGRDVQPVVLGHGPIVWEDDQAWEMLALAVPTSGVWADYVSTTNFLVRTSFDGRISFLGKILMAIFPF